MSRRYKGSILSATAATTANAVTGARGVWTLDQQLQAKGASPAQWPTERTEVDQIYTTPGTYTFVVPATVTSLSTVAIGPGGNGGDPLACYFSGFFYCCFYGYCEPYCYTIYYGGGGGGGGGLSYRNNLTVTPGQSVTVTVGSPGSGPSSATYPGGASYVAAYAGGNGGSYSGRGARGEGFGYNVTANTRGGLGGAGSSSFGAGQARGGGGGGSPTYDYCVGNSGGDTLQNGSSGNMGAGGGGGGGTFQCGAGYGGGGGGGIGVYGSVAGGFASGGARGCTFGQSGGGGGAGFSGTAGSGGGYGGGNGGLYGGGGGGGAISYYTPGSGSSGAVRIVGPGNTRQFPSTNVGP